MATLGANGRRLDFSSAADAVEGLTSLPFRFSGSENRETDDEICGEVDRTTGRCNEKSFKWNAGGNPDNSSEFGGFSMLSER
jgi:hypothetical protein